MNMTPDTADGVLSWNDCLAHFRADCAAGNRPNLAQLSERVSRVSAEDRPDVLVDLVAEHLRQSWQAGWGMRLEEYMEALGSDFDVVASAEALPCDLVECEFIARHKYPGSSDHPDLAEYDRRYPGRPDVHDALNARCLDGGRYVKVQLMGQGGLGRVWSAYDQHLRRHVAVKEPLPGLARQAEVLTRLEREARVTAGLEHPAIVSVHEMHPAEAGPPFYVMRLVHGRTLQEALTGEDGKGQVHWNELLQVFTTVCEALAYAHSRGVIHRDLKPSNIMVGSFGEVQVMDWGMAKVLRRSESANGETPPPHERPTEIHGAGLSSAVDASEPGAVLGTPAYMAPEQARGEVENLDERADVFGLGAMLYVLLTGQPPYVGEANEVSRQAAAGDLADAIARLDGCGADAELILLCKECLAVDRKARPRDARVVARRMTDYQAGVQARLRRAELERAAAQARADGERKRRRLAVGLAAAVLGLVVVGSASGLWAQRVAGEWRAAASRQRAAVEAALDKLPGLLRRWRWQEAVTVLDEMDRHLGEAGPTDLRGRATKARDDLRLAIGLDNIRLRRATLVEGKFDDKTADQDYAAALAEMGVVPGQGDEEQAAARVRGSAIVEQLVAALDDWAAVTKDPRSRAWLLGVARRADPDDWRDRFRDPALWRHRGALEALAAELLRDEQKLAKQTPQLLAALGNALRGSQGNAVPLVTEARRLYPSDFWLNFDLGTALQRAKQWEAALGCYRAALAVRPETAAVYNNLGNALHDKKQLDEAIREFRKALALDPTFAAAHNNLGNALRDKKQLDDAIAAYRKALDFNPNSAAVHNNLGLAWYDKKQWDEALREHQKALALDPNDASAHNNLGNALLRTKQLDEAIAKYRAAIALDPQYALPHNGLGNALFEKRQLAEAIREYRTAIALDPQYALPRNGLGNALFEKRQSAEAVQEYRTAIALDPQYASPHDGLGTVLQARGQLDEAIGEHRKALALDPNNAAIHNNLGTALSARRRPDDAIASYRAALALDPKFAAARYNLGIALKSKNLLDEASKEYRTAIALDSKHALAFGALGEVYLVQGRFVEARTALRRCLELLPPNHSDRPRATRQLRQCEQALDLDNMLPAILEGEDVPADNARRLALAQFCLEHKKLNLAAVHFYQEAFAADAQLADDLAHGYRYNAACAAALAGCGQGKDADQIGDQERARLRQQALDWLQTDLALWTKQAASDQPKDLEAVKKQLKHWRADADLAGLRDQEAITKLPAAERDACRQLWDDVAALLKRASEPR
jgi:tetratricopeptide (TPR) repeat protein